VEDLLANPEVELVINLTIPAAHAEVSLKALEAGKHVHCEKPLAVELADGKRVLETAAEKGLKVGCAPDTFLGAGLQTCRKLVDDGWIGRPVAGTAFMMGRGPESWHPNPAFFYQTGGGPMFDMGPYYITALIHLLGPVKRVMGVTSRAFEKRIATSEGNFGRELPVEVPTHNVGALEFHCGASITMTISFDVYAHGHKPIEIYGTEGSMQVPDPNTFGGPVNLWTPTEREWREQAFSHRYASNMRGIGAADMAMSIRHGTAQRTSGELAYHVLEVMHAFETSSTTGEQVMLESRPAQPAPLPLGLIEGRLA
jgi:predicted dehydrogenase